MFAKTVRGLEDAPHHLPEQEPLGVLATAPTSVVKRIAPCAQFPLP